MYIAQDVCRLSQVIMASVILGGGSWLYWTDKIPALAIKL